MSPSQLPIKGTSRLQPHAEKILHWAWEENALVFLVIRIGVQTSALPLYQLCFHVTWSGLCFLINTYLQELLGNAVKFSEKINLNYSLR